jgi:hypothetical protein
MQISKRAYNRCITATTNIFNKTSLLIFPYVYSGSWK